MRTSMRVGTIFRVCPGSPHIFRPCVGLPAIPFLHSAVIANPRVLRSLLAIDVTKAARRPLPDPACQGLVSKWNNDVRGKDVQKNLRSATLILAICLGAIAVIGCTPSATPNKNYPPMFTEIEVIQYIEHMRLQFSTEHAAAAYVHVAGITRPAPDVIVCDYITFDRSINVASSRSLCFAYLCEDQLFLDTHIRVFDASGRRVACASAGKPMIRNSGYSYAYWPTRTFTASDVPCVLRRIPLLIVTHGQWPYSVHIVVDSDPIDLWTSKYAAGG